MRYIGMPMGMWIMFGKSFRRNLTVAFEMDAGVAEAVMVRAKSQYKEIIAGLPEFEKADRFKMNIVNCALLSAFVLSMPQRPDVEQVTAYYAKSMMIPAMRWFCRQSGKAKFSDKDIASMKATTRHKAANRNPYSWNMDFYPYSDGSGYEARFTACGICTLMQELGLYDLVPAMCKLDYTMSEAGGASNFVRKYTLASGGPYCDCGYKRKSSKSVSDVQKCVLR
ncbi:MAG: L-2-amino-thiazoline-4-carboxylic acid hydrolase [Eubacteriales bacterium]|nr:L-2-amino-thiazoline-4-carboxylic acid hydrolase [Eubacteriales bacterium]